MTKSLLDKVASIRKTYFNKPLPVGYCSDVAILIGSLLQSEGLFVNMVYGECNGCYHVWLMVDGVAIDPSRDCANQHGEFVCFVNPNEYITHSTEHFDIKDFYTDPDIEELKVNALNISALLDR